MSAAKALRSARWDDDPNRPVFTIPTVLSLLVFFALCCQCASTLAVIKRETHSWRWPIFMLVLTDNTAGIYSKKSLDANNNDLRKVLVAPGTYRIDHDGRSFVVYVTGTSDDWWAFCEGQIYRSERPAEVEKKPRPTATASQITAPMPATRRCITS